MLHEPAAGCLFAAVPIADCGREFVAPAMVIASSWPMTLLFLPIVGLGVYAFIRAIYPHPIDWTRDDEPDWGIEPDHKPTIEIRARHAGE